MTPVTPIRVMIVDDHLMVRKGISTFIKVFDDLELIGEADCGEKAVQFCNETEPDVVLMDLVMPGMDGASATHIIRQKHPSVQVIALTSFKEETLVLEAIQAGAISYLLKDVSADDLAQAIRAANAGKPTFAAEAAEAIVHAANQPDPPGHDLTGQRKRSFGVNG